MPVETLVNDFPCMHEQGYASCTCSNGRHQNEALMTAMSKLDSCQCCCTDVKQIDIRSEHKSQSNWRHVQPVNRVHRDPSSERGANNRTDLRCFAACLMRTAKRRSLLAYLTRPFRRTEINFEPPTTRQCTKPGVDRCCTDTCRVFNIRRIRRPFSSRIRRR